MTQKYENRAGISLARFNDQARWALEKADSGTSLADALGVARVAEREARKCTLKQQRVAAGRAKQAARDEKLSSKRERREKKKKEKVRIEKLELATRYSALKTMGNDELKDQLKAYKLQGKTGFKLTHKDRAAYVIQVQTLMSEAIGTAANDLEDGDSGVDGRGVRKRKVARNEATAGGGEKPGGKKRKAPPKKIVEYNGFEWYEDEEFEIEKLIGKMVANGQVPGRTRVKKGTVLYKARPNQPECVVPECHPCACCADRCCGRATRPRSRPGRRRRRSTTTTSTSTTQTSRRRRS